MYIRNFRKGKIRKKGSSDIKNKFCINFLTEQRSLFFEEDIFNLNELLFLKPIYNKKYQKVVFLNNSWLKDEYYVSEKFLDKKDLTVGDVKNLMERNYLLLPINFLLFLAQVLFMTLSLHTPDLKKLFCDFKKGRIEFYPKDFKEQKLTQFKSD